jgi:hypothetical protein
MSLLKYWPAREEIDRCVKSEAESVSDEVLLAVHQPFPLAYFMVGPDGKVMTDSRKEATEDALLKHLLGSAPEGSLVVPITGASGVGKSHLIRILDARLKNLAHSTRYLVIRIPKSASLRRVVELILEAKPLQGANYETIRVEFEKALTDIPLAQAVILFQAQLRIALDEFATTLRQQLVQEPTNELVRSRLHISKNLPQFLSDAATEKYFHAIFERIIHRSVEGVSKSNTEINPAEGQFKPTDFDLPDTVQIDQASLPVRNFYQTTLLTMGGRGKVIAAEVLNSIVDQATRQLYKLHESLGGKTLGEVIGDIRRLLFIEDAQKELVILVEDFAALVGIQDTLAKILIQHGQMDGTQTLATIRSVIAVTDGYLAGKDTLATRAGREWVVESRFESEEEVLRRTGLLVASYLNASRHGEVTLKKFFRKVHLNKNKGADAIEVPIFSDDTGEFGDALQAFGYIAGIPIFPFTESAIECLARSTLTEGNALFFNPRFIIKNVIRQVLLAGRDSFENEQFPPPEIAGRQLGSVVAGWLEHQGFSPEVTNRYRRLISIWGNNPSTQSDLGCIPNKVFEIFHLPSHKLEILVKPIDKLVKPISTLKTDDNDRNAKTVQDYRNALDRWVQDEIKLDQKIANKIRKALATLINQRIDWGAERSQKREFQSDWISIPNAAGELGIAAEAIVIAESNDDPTGRLRRDLVALLSFVDVYGASVDYDQADDDIAVVSNMIDRLMPKALALLRSLVKRQTQAAIFLLAANSRLLGLVEKGRTVGSISSFLFGEVTQVSELPDTAPVAFKEWRSLQRTAFQVRGKLRQLVTETSGCFQGDGDKLYGVDIVRLVDCYASEYSGDGLSDLTSISKELGDLLKSMRQTAVGVRLNQVINEAKITQSLIANELGSDFVKQEVISIVGQIALNLREAGSWPLVMTYSQYINICDSFRDSEIKNSINSLQLMESEPDDQHSNSLVRISKGARIPLEPLLVANQFIVCSIEVVRAARNHAKTLELQYGGISPSEKAAEMVSAFDQLATDIEALMKG